MVIVGNFVLMFKPKSLLRGRQPVKEKWDTKNLRNKSLTSLLGMFVSAVCFCNLELLACDVMSIFLSCCVVF